MLSVPHLVILFVIALLVFGPEKLPELARMLGKAMSEFRRVTGDVRRVVEDEMRDMELKTREADLRKREAELAAEREKSIKPPAENATSPAEIISGKPLPPAALCLGRASVRDRFLLPARLRIGSWARSCS